MSVAQQVEQKETMAIQYTIELRKMLNDMPVRDEIREFLFKVWAEVLAMAALRYGAQQQTVMLKKSWPPTWSGPPAPSPTAPTAPRSSRTCRSCCSACAKAWRCWAVDEPQEKHIKTIGDTLADAFLSKTESIPQAKIEAMTERLAQPGGLRERRSAARRPAARCREHRDDAGHRRVSIEVVPDGGCRCPRTMLAWAHELQVGNWFMLDHNDKREPGAVRLAQRPPKQLHLFAYGGRPQLPDAGCGGWRPTCRPGCWCRPRKRRSRCAPRATRWRSSMRIPSGC
jgi:hypothetical protein